MTFREATVADAELISAFARRLCEETFAPDNNADDLALYLHRAFTPDAQGRELADPTRTSLLGHVGGTLACYALIRVGASEPSVAAERPVEVERFYVDTPWQGHGVAQRLMQQIIDFARDRTGDVLWLGVWEKNPRAIRFYTKLGFRDVGSHPFLVGTDLQTDRVMALSLASRA